MRALPILLADEEVDTVLSSWSLTNPSTREAIIIFGAIGLVTILVLIWAIYFRKRRRRHSHHHSHHHSSEPTQSPEAPVVEAPATPSPHHHRRRHRRRGRRTLNPTLAQTGGLPPLRTESPPEPRP